MYREIYYDDPDMRERRENIAARRTMSEEAADLWTQGSLSNRTDSAAGTNSATTSLPELEIGSDGQDSRQTGSQSESAASLSSTDSSPALDTTAGDDRSRATDTRLPDALDVVSIVHGGFYGINDVRNALANVNQQQVQDGLTLGVMRGFQPTASMPYGQGVANLYNWLDGQIPRDGTTQTEDRRTALLVSTAYADAQAQHPDDPSRWEQDAYDSLLYLRTSMYSGRDQLSPELRGRESDPDIGAAEHFFETSLLVDRGVGLGLPDVVAGGVAQIVNNVYGMYQAARRVVDSSYESSTPGYFRSRWEAAGVFRGVQRQDEERISGVANWENWGDYDYETGETGAADEDVQRIVIIGEHPNVNRGIESSGSNPELSFVPDAGERGGGSGGSGSSFDTNSGSDSGMLADGGSWDGAGGGFGGGWGGGIGSGGGGGGGIHANYEWY